VAGYKRDAEASAALLEHAVETSERMQVAPPA
jgi:hypothetical protein